MLHQVLKGLCPAIFLVVQSALDGRVEASGREIGLKTSVDRQRVVLVEPRVQLLYFARRERSDGAFNLVDGV
jgi:hypothetical protein